MQLQVNLSLVATWFCFNETWWSCSAYCVLQPDKVLLKFDEKRNFIYAYHI